MEETTVVSENPVIEGSPNQLNLVNYENAVQTVVSKPEAVTVGSLHNPPSSILSRQTTHFSNRHMGLGYSEPASTDFDVAVAEDKANHNAHNEIQSEVMLDGYKHCPLMEGEFEPVHVHSVHTVGDSMLVTSQKQLDTVMATGDWSNTPLEIVKKSEKYPDGIKRD
jgi:hypothetical protein